jgi:hypothetical protein
MGRGRQKGFVHSEATRSRMSTSARNRGVALNECKDITKEDVFKWLSDNVGKHNFKVFVDEWVQWMGGRPPAVSPLAHRVSSTRG